MCVFELWSRKGSFPSQAFVVGKAFTVLGVSAPRCACFRKYGVDSLWQTTQFVKHQEAKRRQSLLGYLVDDKGTDFPAWGCSGRTVIAVIGVAPSFVLFVHITN